MTVTSMSGAGLTWVLVRRTNAQLGTAEIWRAFAPARLSGVTVQANLSESVGASITVVTLTGVDTSGANGAGAVGATGSANANPGAPNASLVTTRDNSWVFGVGNDWDNAKLRSVPSNQTMVSQYLAAVGDTWWVQRLNGPAGAAGTTVTINDTSPATDRYNLSIVEILAATVSGSTFTVSGSITPASLGTGAIVTLSQSGTSVSTASADTGGNYSFTSVANGTYTVTPSKSGVNFSPTSQSVTVSGGPATVAAFTSVATTFTASGTITPASLGTGTTVTLNQGGTTVSTASADTGGNYSFTSVANGTYTVTPSKPGVNFSPTSQSVTVSGGPATVAVFTAVATTFSISGTIAPASLGTGTTVSLGQGGTIVSTATANSSGIYNFASLANGTYTVTPSKPGVSFSPGQATVSVSGANVSAINFVTSQQVTQTLFTTQTPAVVNLSDGASVNYELGMKFTSDATGQISAIRFWKDSRETGAHTGHIWSATGQLLATVTFTGETASGWQQQALSTPLSINAGTVYVVSVNTGGTYYVATNNGLGAQVVNQHLSSVVGGNGIYGTLRQFPTNSWQNSNYFRDVVFTTNGGGAVDTIPPTVTGRTPTSGATSVAVGTTVTATFSEALAPNTVTTSQFTLQGPGTTPVLAMVSYNSATFTAILTPSSPLANNTLYTAMILGGTSGVKDIAGNALTASASWPFTTTAAQTWTISGTLSPVGTGSGATVALGGTASATVTANTSGNYSFVGLTNGSYAVTPSKVGVTFSPVSQVVTVAGANVSGVNFTGVATNSNLTVNGSQTFQTVDGMGVNINVNSWNGGQLAPALDLLVDTHGSSVLRVIRDPIDWVSSESLITPLHNLDQTTLQQVYEAPKMQDIWNTIAYLNQKGLRGNQIMLNFMGWTPTWLGGSGAYGVSSYITPGKESSFATMVASLVYYGRKVKNLDFALLGPMNEEDWNCLEGPCVSASQYVVVLDKLIAELDLMGLTDVRLVGPDTASGASTYISAMMADTTIKGRVDHLGMHSYSGSAVSPGTSYAPKNYWLTETSAWCSSCDIGGTVPDEWGFARDTNQYILGDLANGFSGVLIWEGYDSFYYHHNSWSYWGSLAYNQSTGVYTPRKRFYANAQLSRFIRPGSVRIAVSSSLSGLTVVAFSNPTTGQVTIVGHNTSTSAITINGQLQNLSAPSSLMLYQTNSSVNLQRGADIPVVGGTFSVSIPADTFFSLTN